MTSDEKKLRERVRACREWYSKSHRSGNTVESIAAARAVQVAERELENHRTHRNQTAI